MEVTIYELLGMVKDGKAPKTIRWYDNFYKAYDEISNDYKGFIYQRLEREEWDLNDIVEILEEEKKIPEKLDYCKEHLFDNNKTSCLSMEERRLLDSNFKELGNKINSIIDYLKSKGDE